MNFPLGKWLLLGFVICSLGEPACAGRWLTLTNCRYLPNAANDGDSFHVRAEGREYIFRLYFVDTPETDDGIPERVKEQAKYSPHRSSTLQVRTRGRTLHKAKAHAVHCPHLQAGCPRPEPAASLFRLRPDGGRGPRRDVGRQRAGARLWSSVGGAAYEHSGNGVAQAGEIGAGGEAKPARWIAGHRRRSP